MSADNGIGRNIISASATLREAMLRLNQGGGTGGVLFAVDSDGVMVGLLTDGDIRRALLNGGDLDEDVERWMNREFQSGSAALSRSENLKKLTEVIRHLPVLDDGGRPVDMVSWVDIWRLPITEPSLGGNEMKYVSDCISSVWISSQGDYIGRFEAAMCAFLDDGMALCTSSGTTSLQLALAALDVGTGDEVVVPDLTFGATANAVIHAGGTPVFVDIDPDTWTMDPAAFAKAVTPRTKAVIPVHLYGHPCDMDPIMETARTHGLHVIEDCAESLGAEYKGRKVGLIGDIGCFSFFANKVITTGEGGMVVTTSPALHARMELLRDHGMSKTRRYWHLEPGYNFRMTNLQAAIGLAQIERIEDFLDARRRIVGCYHQRLGALDGIRTPPEAPWARNIHWLYSIEVDAETCGIDRDLLAEKLKEEGIDTRPVFPPLHLQPAFGSGAAGLFPESERFAALGLSLPTSNSMSMDDAKRVCDALERTLERERIEPGAQAPRP